MVGVAGMKPAPRGPKHTRRAFAADQPEGVLDMIFRKVAFLGDLPFVVGFDKERAGQTEQRGGVGKYSDDVGAAFEFFL